MQIKRLRICVFTTIIQGAGEETDTNIIIQHVVLIIRIQLVLSQEHERDFISVISKILNFVENKLLAFLQKYCLWLSNVTKIN